MFELLVEKENRFIWCMVIDMNVHCKFLSLVVLNLGVFYFPGNKHSVLFHLNGK